MASPRPDPGSGGHPICVCTKRLLHLSGDARTIVHDPRFEATGRFVRNHRDSHPSAFDLQAVFEGGVTAPIY
ncbi:MAG TPA: hypothetical protein RMG48_19155 [Myxococcales bacterium LLY-WYZ-16_1]|nr:hypothetical protein [Myxococcales bacterium LLY-WYZ-16_1]